ncbi:late competence protein ComEC (Membrane metal-binding protein and hydrolase of the metallo-beta-lactamase superfamily) [Clostridium sp. CAG:762]|nr:late competence protein ComEC (Membrane metal-binding protein and hydrolase of the metallo-beta-lactamase superfamily) [Clostridium sp. CAG:762]
MRKLKTILNLKQKYTFILFITFIIYALIITSIPMKTTYKENDSTFEGNILSIKKYDTKTTFIIKEKNKTEKILVNYYETIDKINLGDKVKIKGTLKLPSKNTVPNLFNYRKYLNNNNIYYILTASEITKIKNNTKILTHYKNKLQKYINRKKAHTYLNIFILSNKNDLDKEVLNSYQVNGLSHLFSISGMHITLLLGTILKLLDKVSYNRYYKYIFLIIILIIYMYLTDFTPSILRSGIMFILLTLNKLFNFKIKTKNIIMLTFIIIVLINPYYIYNLGFQLSYLISFYLIIFAHIINKHKNYFKKLFITSLISFLVSFPIIISNYYQVNLLSILINLLFVPIISYIVLPLAFITLILPTDSLLILTMDILEGISLSLTNINYLLLELPKPSIYLIIIYYATITLLLINKKCFISLLTTIFIHKISINFNPNMEILFLDVSQGDSILLHYPHNKYNILIDTGGNYNYEISKNIIIPYLKSKGINKIDYLILTHGDYDHMGESINLIENFKVEKVIFNCSEFNDLEKELIKVLEKKKIKYYSCIKELYIDKNKLQFLNTKEYDNENDNSSVIYFNYYNYKFLFMGDASTEREKDILEKYNLKDVDFLKVGHHGSNTSSSEEFINSINPKYSLISVRKNNRYGHPNKEVLDTLNDSKIYRTDQDGSIMLKIKNNKLKIETCSP